ncbi:hypothetical protein Cgig2_011639 [Carnegiea gigantea]|uniref:Uncharacterized protein n=1 Tax=Carnegiea gigantea TaxID=171969 RepID=A0A9Q1KH11_9CARY|nr:hypothetical protein Cgig2_011639 [Carnegiea gigantea]
MPPINPQLRLKRVPTKIATRPYGDSSKLQKRTTEGSLVPALRHRPLSRGIRQIPHNRSRSWHRITTAPGLVSNPIVKAKGAYKGMNDQGLAAASSRATTRTQHSDIQYPDHKTEADLECIRQTVASQVHTVDEQTIDKDQHGADIQMMNKAQEGHVKPENGKREMSEKPKIKRKKVKEFINQISPKGLQQLVQNLNDK